MKNSRIRERLLFPVVVALGVVVLSEMAAFVMASAIEGRWFSYARFAGNRDAVLGNSGGEGAELAEAVRDLGLYVTHPYVGALHDKDMKKQLWRGTVVIDEYGFSSPSWSPSSDALDEARTVAVFGGSVAFGFVYMRGVEVLAEELGKLPEFRDRPIKFYCAALGGNKQPQQLMALAYLLVLGADFDMVINLDGYNELALAAGNREEGVFPAYPSRWNRRIASFPDAMSRRRIGQIEFLRETRRFRAAQFDGFPLEFSVSANLLWRFLDRRVEHQINALQSELAAETAADRTFATHGPAREYLDDQAFYSEAAAVWMKSSLEMHHLCAANGIAYFHFLQPNQYVAGSKPLSNEELRDAYLPDSPGRRAVEYGYPLLSEKGRELSAQGVFFEDLTMVFKGVGETIYYDNCCHFNTEGNQLIGQAIARTIIRRREP